MCLVFVGEIACTEEVPAEIRVFVQLRVYLRRVAEFDEVGNVLDCGRLAQLVAYDYPVAVFENLSCIPLDVFSVALDRADCMLALLLSLVDLS